MVATDPRAADSRPELLAKAVVLFGLLVPAGVLVALALVASAAGVAFGNVVFLSPASPPSRGWSCRARATASA